MCDYQCKPLYTFHEGGGGRKTHLQFDLEMMESRQGK